MLNFLKYFIRESADITHHVTFMRANPIHIGHESVVNQVVNAAGNDGHTIFLTRSQDKNKNPLTPDQKIKHARAAFPKANMQLTSDDAPTLLHQASKLHDQGVNNLNLHVGSDRVDSFQKILNSYNGKAGKHGYYNFNNIGVHSVGNDRSDSDDDVAGASATKMRSFANTGNKKAFHAMAPTNMSTKDKDQMMLDIRNGMNPPIENKKKNDRKLP